MRCDMEQEKDKNNDGGSFFVRLAYGYVGKTKDTSKMTTQQVIDEFLRMKGVSSPKEFFQKLFRPESQTKQSNTNNKAIERNSNKAISTNVNNMYEPIKTVNGHDIYRAKGTQGFYYVDIEKNDNSKKYQTFKSIKSATEFAETLPPKKVDKKPSTQGN